MRGRDERWEASAVKWMEVSPRRCVRSERLIIPRRRCEDVRGERTEIEIGVMRDGGNMGEVITSWTSATTGRREGGRPASQLKVSTHCRDRDGLCPNRTVNSEQSPRLDIKPRRLRWQRHCWHYSGPNHVLFIRGLPFCSPSYVFGG